MPDTQKSAVMRSGKAPVAYIPKNAVPGAAPNTRVIATKKAAARPTAVSQDVTRTLPSRKASMRRTRNAVTATMPRGRAAM